MSVILFKRSINIYWIKYLNSCSILVKYHQNICSFLSNSINLTYTCIVEINP